MPSSAPVYSTYVSPDGLQVVKPSNVENETRLARMGWQAKSDQDIHAEAIRKTYDGWKGAANALAVGALEGIPGLEATAVHFMSPENQSALGQAVDAAHVQHPILTGATSLATGAAALSTGEGLLGAGINAAAGAAGVGEAIGGSTLLGAAARAGLTNTVAGVGARKDQQAIAHIMSPGGEEHVANALGWDNLMDFATGATVPVAFHGAAEAVKALGKASKGLADSQFRSALLDTQRLGEIMSKGKASDVWQTVERDMLHTVSPDKARMVVDNKLGQLEKQFKVIKAQALVGFPENAKGQLIDNMGTILNGTPIAADVVARMADGPLTIEKLHSLRQYIDGHIDYKAFIKDPSHEAYGAMNDGREVMSGAINKLLDYNDATGSLSSSWKTLNNDYSTYQAIKHALRTDSATSPLRAFVPDHRGWLSNASVLGLVSHGLRGAFGGMIVNGVVKNAARMHEMFLGGEFAPAAKKLAALFDSTHDRMAGAVEAGLYGAGGVWASANNVHQKSHQDYDVAMAQLQHMSLNQADTFGRMSQAMTDAGMPEDQATSMSQRTSSMASFLLGKRPGSGQVSSTIMARKSTPSLQDKRQFMNYWNAAHDPATVVANPTKQGLEVLQKFYPGFLQDSRQAVLEQLQSNPDLPLAGRQYASKLIGGPVDTLTSPEFGQFMAAARAQTQQQKAQAGNAGSSGKPQPIIVSSYLTRSQQLANNGAS